MRRSELSHHPETLLIRKLLPQDSVAEVTELLHVVFAQGPDQPFAYPVATHNEHTILRQIQKGSCWLAVIDDRIAGAAILQIPERIDSRVSNDPEVGAHLYQLAVHPDFQGRGIGSKLLKACEEDAVQMGAQHVWASSPVHSRQLNLYLRHGYEYMEYYSWPGTNYDSITFRKRLAGTEGLATRLRFQARYARSLVLYKLGVLEHGTFHAVLKRLVGLSIWGASKTYLRWRGNSRKDILICCSDPLMVDYLRPFWELFRDDPRLSFRLVLLLSAQGRLSAERLKYIDDNLPLPRVQDRWARTRAWDLVVCADHSLTGFVRLSPAVYIGHGPKCKVYDGTEYAYSSASLDRHGRVVYTKMFAETEEDQRRAIADKPNLKDIVTVVGNLENDKVVANAGRREELRAQFGFAPDDVVVYVLSTWGEHCVWHTIGDGLLEQARTLPPGFKFILSAHPNEYLAQPGSQRVWGEYLRTQKQYGFLVREPSESWIPYLVASDIVISDYTGLIEYAVLLQKRIVLTPVPEDLIWQESVTGRIREFAPRLDDPRNLHQCLIEARDNYPEDKLRELAQFVHPYPGEAAGRIRREIYALLQTSAPK